MSLLEVQLKRIRSQVKRRHASLQKDADTATKLMVTTVSDAITTTELIDQLDEHITIVTDSLKIYDGYAVELSENTADDQAFEAEVEEMADFSIEVGRWVSKMTAYRNRLQGRIQVPQPSPNIHNDSTGGAANATFDADVASTPFAGIEQQLSRLLDHTFNNGGSTNSNTNNQSAPTVKFPKLELRKFDGNLLKFKEFWDTFKVAVDQNPKLQPVEKMNYLLSQVEGEAKATISGLELTNDSYPVAVALIKERFGNPQTLVSSLYSRLMNLPVTPNNTVKLRSLYDELECIMRSLVSLHQEVDNQQFVSIILSKLPHEVVLTLERSKGLGTDWTTDFIRRVFHAELCAREAAERSRGCSTAGAPASTSGFSKGTIRPQRSTGEALYAADKGPKNSASSRKITSKRCIYCDNESHWSDECRKFPSAGVRREKLKVRCYNCLGKSHSTKTCTIQKSCPYCSKTGHHRSLCKTKFGATQSESAHVAAESESAPENGSSQTSNVEESLLSIGGHVLLQTVTTGVKKVGATGYADVRLLMDSACHRSYITEALARQLKLKMQEGEIISVNTFGSTRHNDVATKTAIIELKTKVGKPLQINVNVVPHITGDVQRSPVMLGGIAKLWENLQLPDHLPTEKEISTIDILIGSDFYLDIITGEKIKVRDGLYLLGSCFGWILSGRIDSQSRCPQNDLSMLVISHTNTIRDNPLIARVDSHLPLKINFEDYWHLETIGITDPPDVTNDDRAIQSFEDTIKFENGRYQVCFPWKDEAPELASNFNLSFCRLKSVVEKRLSDNSDLLCKYNDIIEDQLKKGVIEKIEESVRDGPRIHYLPHHPVITEQKATTKVRIVYDASAKSKKGTQSSMSAFYVVLLYWPI